MIKKQIKLPKNSVLSLLTRDENTYNILVIVSEKCDFKSDWNIVYFSVKWMNKQNSQKVLKSSRVEMFKIHTFGLFRIANDKFSCLFRPFSMANN